jgi:hypothetical protein
MLTRESLQLLSEDGLRHEVLIPLFQAMGFLDVQLHHGGALEQGKDIVMWKRDDIRGRINYAVVAKSRQVSGKASGPSSAGEVVMQLQQCFGRPFQDAVTLENREVDRCIVACPFELKKEAKHAVTSGLDSRLVRNVDFFCGETLWESIEKHLGPRAVVGKLQEAGRVLNDASPHHRVVAHVRGDQVALGLEQKHPGASEAEPLVFHGSFAFPDDDEGRAAMEALEQHIKTGAPVSIPSRFIKEWNPPEVLRPFISGPLEALAMAPLPSGHTIVADLCCETPSGRVENAQGLRLKEVQHGTDEVTFECKETGCPYQITMSANRVTHRVHINLSIDISALNVRLALEAVRVRNALAEGGKVILRDSGSRLVVVHGEVPSGLTEAAPLPFERFLENLVLIQSVTRHPIQVPDRDFTEDDVRTAAQVAQVLREGNSRVSVSSVRVTLEREGVRKLLEQGADSGTITMVARESAQMCDVEVPLGRVVRVISGLAVQDRTRLESELKSDCTDPMEVTLAANSPGSDASIIYVDYIPPEERARYRHLLKD